jgi:hypothetical protein
MELKKQDLLKIINEQHYEVDEMAGRTEHGYDTKGRAEADIIKDSNGNTIGFKMMDYNGDEAVKIPILMVCGGIDAVQRILDENPELIQEIKYEFPGTAVRWSKHKKDINSYCLPPRSTNHQTYPLPGEENDVQPYVANTTKPVDTPRSATTNIKRDLHAIVKDKVADRNPEATERLKECSVPVIYGSDIQHINRYGLYENNGIKYQTHNVDIYDSVEEFLEAAQNRVLGDQADAKFDSKHMRYKYNKLYSNWNETRRMNIDRYGQKKEYQGKTAVYDVDYMDFTNGQSDASVISELTIIGEMDQENGRFTWKASFDIKFGDALAKGIRNFWDNKLSPSKTLTGSTTVEFDPRTTFNDNNTILNNEFIYQGLVSVLDDLRGKFFTEIEPIDALTLPELSQSRITGDQEAVNEQLVDRIVDKIMKRK